MRKKTSHLLHVLMLMTIFAITQKKILHDGQWNLTAKTKCRCQNLSVFEMSRISNKPVSASELNQKCVSTEIASNGSSKSKGFIAALFLLRLGKDVSKSIGAFVSGLKIWFSKKKLLISLANDKFATKLSIVWTFDNETFMDCRICNRTHSCDRKKTEHVFILQRLRHNIASS